MIKIAPQMYSIVGGYYRPPALAILKYLPARAELLLAAEFDNPYDKQAIAVYAYTQDILAIKNLDEFETALSNFGITLEDIAKQERWHLGYIPKNADKGGLVKFLAIDYAFGQLLLLNGKPMISVEEIEYEEEEEEYEEFYNPNER